MMITQQYFFTVGYFFGADILVSHRKEFRITQKVLRCGAGEGWWRSVAPVV
jgi:hypothetical protein